MNLNLRLVKNGMANALLAEQQTTFMSERDRFKNDFIGYSQEFETLLNMNCKNEPQKFYKQLEIVREKRADINSSMKRMKDIGCTVSMGTDNAMLCTPDLRPEAALFREILGSAEYDGWIWECMTAGATELLYRTRGIHACKREEEYIVLPLSGTGPESAWSSADRVPSL